MLRFIGVLAFAFAASAVARPPADILVWADEPQAFADLPLTSVDDGPTALSDFHGQWTIVNLWATWCAPCLAELPSFDRLAAALEHAGVAVAAISVDRAGLRVAEPFLRERIEAQHLTPIVAKGSDVLAANGDVKALPMTLIFDPEGREAARAVGEADWDDAAFIADMTQRAATLKSRPSTATTDRSAATASGS
ncbi:MAG: TlpA disulfide reductase family protein [Pseudomonadota bacterium]